MNIQDLREPDTRTARVRNRPTTHAELARAARELSAQGFDPREIARALRVGTTDVHELLAVNARPRDIRDVRAQVLALGRTGMTAQAIGHQLHVGVHIVADILLHPPKEPRP